MLRGRGPAAAARAQDPQVEDFVDMARTILKNAPASRGVVLSVGRLAGDPGTPLIDTTTTTVPSRTSPRRRLKNPPRHLASPEIFEVCSPRLRRTFRYVWILSNEQATHPVGGMLFLPASWERDVRLVTLNVGNLDDARCRNAHHAEMQLVRWVEEQPASWWARLRTVHIANRSRSTRIRGYSPCKACCADLVRFLLALKALPGRPWIDARLSWCQRYTRNKRCGHETDQACLARLRGSGWQLPDPPPAPRPASLPAPPARAGTILAARPLSAGAAPRPSGGGP